LDVTQSSVSVGVDLGGTSVRIGVYDTTLQLLLSHSMPTRVAAGPQAVVEEIAAIIATLLQSHGSGRAVGIGIGSPGPINLQTGVLGLLPNFPGWDNFPLRDALREAIGIPVFIESDANAAALAEWKYGSGKTSGLQSMAMITLGTGVGSGLILDGRIWHGMFGMGGEVGHATVDPYGLPCACGSRGCLEMYASANGVIRLARGLAESEQGSAALRHVVERPDSFSPLDIAQLAEQGDHSAMLVFERMGFYLGVGVANLINTLDLPMIVIGGGIASAWDLFAPAMFEAVHDFSVVYRLAEPTQRKHLEHDRTYIRPAIIGPSAGLLGAGMLPFLSREMEFNATDPRLEERYV
jgi:glucokinase